jgi:hypothetical protein
MHPELYGNNWDMHPFGVDAPAIAALDCVAAAIASAIAVT